MKKVKNIGKWGVVGMLLIAILSPCCFPIFALFASALGLGSFELFGGWTMWIFQGMVVVSLIGFYISYRKHRCMYPLFIAIPSSILIFYGYHFNNAEYWIYFVYAGMLGLLIATVIDYFRNKLHSRCCTTEEEIELHSTITCPNCGHKKEEIMPTDACSYFYDCKTVLKPLKGDCCVYCSYGTVKCPPIQNGESCC
jgi:hypothetical protein